MRLIKKIGVVVVLIFSCTAYDLSAQIHPDSLMSRRVFAIAAPNPDNLDEFIEFMKDDLAPNHINTLILRVEYGFEYESHPELRNNNPLSKEDVKKLVKVANETNIELIPQVNLLGHQSWASSLGKLLEVYPQFDETPHIKMPEKYEWPNEDGLYCKSYCPLHPEVHDVVFALVDEIMEVFEAKAFHAGMDEVFYIGDDQCPRCKGKDKAELFAGEVTRIRNHLAQNEQKLWIWGDRLLDGSTTGLGMWEASMNNTHRAIDMIPQDVVICDWHYNTAPPTPAYFATKGFNVIFCAWNKPQVIKDQFDQIVLLKTHSNPEISDRLLGIMQTVWSGPDGFLEDYNNKDQDDRSGIAKSYDALIEKMKEEVE